MSGEAAPFDLLIRGGLVVDGTGTPPITREVAIRDGRIAALDPPSPRAREVLDAEGCWVTPGFIDPHTHLDAQLCWDASGVTGPIGTFDASIVVDADRIDETLGGTFSSCLPLTLDMPFVSTDTARVASSRIWSRRVTSVGTAIAVPEVPGHGVDFAPDAIDRYRVD